MVKLEDTYNEEYEYELWALGYDGKSFVVPMEEQIGETATDKEEFLELVAEAKSLSLKQLEEMFGEQIDKLGIKSIQLQIEELHGNDEDGIEGEPVYERLIELA